MFSKILIANRGEIACRIIRTAKKKGIKTVAVYSQADAQALHVKLADEAVCIGAPPALQSYLDAEKIIEVALKTGAQAIHPGYGFLSENAAFATLCEKNQLVFIGPSAQAIQKMGDKGAAKAMMQKADVPVIPGGEKPSRDFHTLQEMAEKVGFPVLLKACAGGGGKGMRVVYDKQDFEEALLSAQREAQKSFGDDHFIIEKYFPRAKHIEVQVFGDKHGHYVYLFERDCSWQRRFQKVIEEAPAAGLSSTLREKMGQAAVNAAQAIGYYGAGTIEFLLTPDNQFYFMEMNTRLQVEHPVTECVTNTDLVDWQLLVACGEPLPLSQNEIILSGHAIEARLYAEDPRNHFLPSIGTLRILKWPAATTDNDVILRMDTGVEEGDEISVYYDPLIAKVIVWAPTRERAIAYLEEALGKIYILGLTTNLYFLRSLLTLPVMQTGQHYTTYIQEHEIEHHSIAPFIFVLMAAVYYWKKITTQAQADNPWSNALGWRLNTSASFFLTFQQQEKSYRLQFLHFDHNTITLGYEEQILKISLFAWEKEFIEMEYAGTRYAGLVAYEKGQFEIAILGQLHKISVASLSLGQQFETGKETANLNSPMPGTIIQMPIQTGSEVEQGDVLFIIEAMKMEYIIRAPFKGAIKQIYFQEGDFVTEGAQLVEFE